MNYDKIIIGAGLYGLYAAQKCGAAGQRVLVLERDPAPFMRATYINQARVHMGYHYPRSYSTAIKSAHYFQRFCEDYAFCLHTKFDQVYATSAISPGPTPPPSGGSVRRRVSGATMCPPPGTSIPGCATVRSSPPNIPTMPRC